MRPFLIYGFGVTDAPTSHRVNGKSVPCPHYTAWESMLIRCYSEKHRHKFLSYAGCSVDERWRTFSEFKAWRINQAWEGRQLDKDLLVEGNRVYGPDTCAMISPSLNTFLIPVGHPDCLPGVIPVIGTDRFKPVRYTRPFTLAKVKQPDTEFDTQEEAHEQWRINKHEIALLHAEKETDLRVVHVLRTRWAP